MKEIKREELAHLSEVLESFMENIDMKDSTQLRELSNQTIHSSCIFQHRGLIAIAVIVYTLSKIIERKDYEKVKNWNTFVKKFQFWIQEAIKSLKEKNLDGYDKNLEEARKTLESISPSMKNYIREVLRKASINKASKIYEHGLSMEKTANMLGITQWELSNYLGEQTSKEMSFTTTMDVKKRAKLALEFLS